MKSTERLLVIGAGSMGNGIAHVAALAGIETTLHDLSSEALERAQKNITKNLDHGVNLKKVTPDARDGALGKLKFSTDLKASAPNAEFLIEAVPEKMDLKCDLFKTLNAITPKETIFASNTSSFSIATMAQASGRPGLFIGMHFFNPVHKMKLVEIVMGRETQEGTFFKTVQLAQQLGKETVRVKESPGFVTTRMNALIGNEAFRILESGVASAEDIDKALRLGLNHPMGPFELVDLVGLDTRLSILQYLHRTLGDLYRPSPLLEQLVRQGRLGRKTGRGVYSYEAP